MQIAITATGSGNGNGTITPTSHWQANGLDCYYGRYQYTYPNGSTEYGTIVWPFCYEPSDDPFHRPPPRVMRFPPPLPGYRLPPGTDLPPIEKSFYEYWMSTNPG